MATDERGDIKLGASVLCQGAVLNGQKRWEEAVAILVQGQAALLGEGSEQESAQAQAIGEQLELAERELAKARRAERGS
jgi:hypothetical protein|eukprot:COSAG03_NODE_1178_length_4640_cov_47.734420_5_plen_79_part_00